MIFYPNDFLYEIDSIDSIYVWLNSDLCIEPKKEEMFSFMKYLSVFNGSFFWS